MARNPKLRIDIDAQDKASKVIDDVADKAEKLDTMDAEVEVTVDDQASDELADIRDKLNRLDKDEARVLLRAETKDARADLRAAQRELIDLDDEEAEVEVKADIAQAKRRLDAIQDEAEQLDRMDPDVDVSVSGGEVLSEMLDAIPGPIGEMVGGFQQLGPGGLIAATAAGTFAIAENVSNAAIEAQTYADLSGTSVEYASQLLSVAKLAGIEANDINDITLQTTQGLQDNAEYAELLGINLDDGRSPAERLVQVLDLMNNSQLTANEKAEVFGALLGEEGVRQGQRLVTTVGDVGEAMEGLDAENIITDADVDQARAYKEQLYEAQQSMDALVLAAGEFAIPAASDALELLNGIKDTYETVVGFVPPDLRKAWMNFGPPGWFINGGTQIKRGWDWLWEQSWTPWGDDGTYEGAVDIGKGYRDQMDLTAEALTEMREEAEAAEEAELELEEAHQASAEAMAVASENAREHAEALDEARTAADEMQDAQRRAVDAYYNVFEQATDTNEALAETKEVLDDAAEGSVEYTQASIDTARTVQALADAETELARETAAKSGVTLTDARANEINNASMLRQAATLEGPQQRAILNHIRAVNDIPDDVMTEIEAAVARGDLAHAERLINGTANKNYQANISVRANTWAAENALNWAARDRDSRIRTIGGHTAARGTPYSPGGTTLVGEEGPEVVNLPMGAAVTDAQASKGKMARMGGSGAGGGGVTNNYNVVQHFPPGINARDVAKAQREYSRRNA